MAYPHEKKQRIKRRLESNSHETHEPCRNADSAQRRYRKQSMVNHKNIFQYLIALHVRLQIELLLLLLLLEVRLLELLMLILLLLLLRRLGLHESLLLLLLLLLLKCGLL